MKITINNKNLFSLILTQVFISIAYITVNINHKIDKIKLKKILLIKRKSIKDGQKEPGYWKIKSGSE